MNSADRHGNDAIQVDVANLYLEETITDRKNAVLRRLTPIKPDGSPDEGRRPVFIGQTYVGSHAGLVLVEVCLRAQTLEEAIVEFPDAIRPAVGRSFGGGAYRTSRGYSNAHPFTTH